MHRRVALIAYSLRFPGTNTQNFWNDLLANKDLVTEVDSTRWSKDSFWHPDKRHPGTSYTFAAGSLGDISGFDASFFGISPREAALIDPQQRLLLELAWETIENAGIVPSALRGSECGVYVGISNVDYAYRLADDLAAIDAPAATGIISSIAANRISYAFDLHGPSISMDTACSSSLVAFHQACLAIRAGEIEMALAGGVNLHLHPYGFISFAKATMLSKTGRCHVFDESGDGYVRSEGGGLFLLKEYEQAIADGDPILAIVAGSAVNTDGHKSGLTIPNPNAQAALIAKAYQQAQISPDAIDYFEAHGTGTAVGDPIETHAIGIALGQKRTKPLPIGSIKSNLGHLESASGVAGVVKALNCIKHRQVPATISIKRINPKINCQDWNLHIVTQNESLKPTGSITIGVNSFGFGGANAHVILQSPVQPNEPKPPSISTSLKPLFIFAKQKSALVQAANTMADWLTDYSQNAFYDTAYSTWFHREHHQYGAVVFAETATQAADILKRYALSEPKQPISTQAKIIIGKTLENAKGPAFAYSGNGCQWAGMGAKLLQEAPLFRDTVVKVDQLFSQYADFSLLDELAGVNGDRFADTEIAQPALFALQVGITELLRAHGIQPVAVLGHSVGEVAAAWACGALSLAEAVKVIYYRSFHQGKTKGKGGMTAVALGADDMRYLLNHAGVNQVYLAGINSQRGVTLAGSINGLTKIERQLSAQNIVFKRLDLDYAFHSPAMDVAKTGILSDLADLVLNPLSLPFYSTVTGKAVSNDELNANYWWHNIRKPVLFQSAVDELLASGVNAIIEVGAHPVLQSYLNEALKKQDQAGLIVASSTKQHSDYQQIKHCVGQSLLSGINLDMSHWFPSPGAFVTLPNYSWQRESYWHPVTSDSYGLLNRYKVHPLLGYPLKQQEYVWENQLDTQLLPYLADHNVGGAIIFPGAGFIELALAAAFQTHGSAILEIEELEIRSPLVLNHDQTKSIRVHLDISDNRISIRSKEQAKTTTDSAASRETWQQEWHPHCVGRLLIDTGSTVLKQLAPDFPSHAPDFDANTHKRLTENTGLEYGPSFQAMRFGWITENTAIAVLVLPEVVINDSERYFLHPSLLDSAFQLVFQILKNVISELEGIAFVPVKIGRISVRSDKKQPVIAQATLLKLAPHSLTSRFVLYAADGSAIAVLDDVRFRAVRLHKRHTRNLRYLEYHLTPAPLMLKTPSLENEALLSAIVLEPSAVTAIKRYNHEVEPLLDSLCNQFVFEALNNFADHRGFINENRLKEIPTESANHLLTRILAYSEAQQLAHPTRYALALEAFLANYGTVKPNSAAIVGWQLKRDYKQSGVTATAIWNTLIQEYPDYFYPIHLTGRIGSKLPLLLTGETTIEELGICANDYQAVVSQIIELTSKKLLVNTIIQHCINLSQTLMPGQRLRILEISAYKPEFGSLLCAELKPELTDYCYASFNDDALAHAHHLREHYPLIQVLNLANELDNNSGSNNRIKPANFAIISIAMANIQDVQRILNYLPQCLTPGSQVYIIGLEPARWLDALFGCTNDWWLNIDAQQRISPQLSSTAIIDQLKLLPFTAIHQHTSLVNHDSGAYLISARVDCHEHSPLLSTATTRQHWLLLASDRDPENALAQQLAEQLHAKHQQVTVINPERVEAWLPLFNKAAAENNAFNHIIHLYGYNQTTTGQTLRCWLATTLVQTLEATSTPLTLWLFTHQVGTLFSCDQTGSLPTPTGIAHDAALWGFGRSLMNEASSFTVRLLDLNGDVFTRSVIEAIIDECLHPDYEQEVVLDAAGHRFAPRIRSRERLIKEKTAIGLENGQAIQLGFKLPGQLRNLQWLTIPHRSPGDDEIEVEVKATGLNFRDVMYTLGLLSDEAVENGFVGASLGLEFSGIILRTGAKVHKFKAGDQVVGMGPASFSNRVWTKANAVALIPNDMSYTAAATIPSTFFTAYYALHYQARLQKGERVLIHGAAGGVGIAAIQVAQWLGAEIYATAGSEEKRDFLHLLGIEHVFDSRSLGFAEQILAVTQRRGVDVILNSLAGEAINRNFQVLKPFGRFLELGKRDFYENTHIGLRPFRNNISYFGIDADQLLRERPELTQRAFNELMGLFRSGHLHPLPYTVFDANQVTEAFRYMQQARQIGKIVVTYDNGIHAKPTHKDQPKTSLQLNDTGSYLITGGLSGFGLATARWLAQKGARHLLLVSRSGAISEATQQVLDELTANGVNIITAACDVSDKNALTTFIQLALTQVPVLKGIFHAAAVIDDSLVRNLTYQQLQEVLMPKIQGAEVLHELSLQHPIELFVLYSSVTTLFGNPGQSNYVAANHWLEALAAYRHQQGLPATCVCWGAIGDTGYLTRHEKIKEALQTRMGGAALTTKDAFTVLEQLLCHPNKAATLGVLEFDWRALSAFLPTAKSPKFIELAGHTPSSDNNDNQSADIKRMMNELSDADLKLAFIDILKEELSQILLINKDKIDPNQSMYDMGLDSLMGVELMIAIESRFDVQIPVMALSEAPTLNKLAARLLAHLRGDIESAQNTTDTLANINDLSKRHGSEVSAEQMSALTQALADTQTSRIIH